MEEGRFGGTCLNVGCIPTKMYVLAADAARNVSEAARLGVHAHVDSIDWDSIKERVFAKRIDAIADGGEYWRGPQTPNIDVYDRHAVFVAASARARATRKWRSRPTRSSSRPVPTKGPRFRPRVGREVPDQQRHHAAEKLRRR